MKSKQWTPETLGRALAEIGAIDPPPCHICPVEVTCTEKRTYLVCGDFSKLLNGVTKEA